MKKIFWAIASGMAILAAGACDGGRPPPSGTITSATSGTQSSSTGIAGPMCGYEGACGTQIHAIEFDAPNVYFVLDRSGSMADRDTNNSSTRYTIVREAAYQLLRRLGPLINPGAAVFPGQSNSNLCASGAEVMATTPGDEFRVDGTAGPVAQKFASATDVEPIGGTPVAPTLAALASTLGSLPGKTIALLLTDGGPNCNANLLCTADQCIINIEGGCEPGVNCCASDHPTGGPQLCLDTANTVTSIESMETAGVDLYVIGIPGSEAYEDVLNQMAEAAGTAKSGATKYHQVSDLGNLGDVMAQIAAENLSCEIALSEPPETRDRTNVYVDCEILPADPVDGWEWLDDETVVLRGEACVALKRGEVQEVVVATGCPTEQPN